MALAFRSGGWCVVFSLVVVHIPLTWYVEISRRVFSHGAKAGDCMANLRFFYLALCCASLNVAYFLIVILYCPIEGLLDRMMMKERPTVIEYLDLRL